MTSDVTDPESPSPIEPSVRRPTANRVLMGMGMAVAVLVCIGGLVLLAWFVALVALLSGSGSGSNK